MTGPLVVVTSRSFSSGRVDMVAPLEAEGVRVVRHPPDHELHELRTDLADAVAWIAGTGPVTAHHLDAAPQLRLIARYGVGVDAVDLRAAAERHVMVTNTPGANSDAVAEHALALLLAALRDVVDGDRRVRHGDWGVRRTRELGDLCVGLVGLGMIGRAFARRLRALQVTVLATDPAVDADTMSRLDVRSADLAQLAEDCDVVSLHAPGSQQLIDRSWLERAGEDLILINTARADLVDDAALADALAARRIRCYATDVADHDERSPLFAARLMDRVVITPHCAAHTVGAVDRMTSESGGAVLAVLAGGRPDHLVAPADGSWP